MSLEQWVNPKYLDQKNRKSLKSKFIANTPFEHLELTDFFVKQKAAMLLESLSKEQFFEKESDLFKFLQTNDMASTSISLLQEFHALLRSNEFIELMQDLTGLKLKNSIDLAGNIYQDTDFLLCHDDKLEGRKIAFLIYLSDMSPKDGGQLNLFDSKKNLPDKVAKKIVPKFNSFTFFKVSPKSFHSVGEVVSDTQRITFNGWFHG